MLNQLMAKLSRTPRFEAVEDVPVVTLNDEMVAPPLVLQSPVAAKAPTYDPHHIIEVVDELIGHLIDNDTFIGCLKELEGFESEVFPDGIESALFRDQSLGAYLAEKVCGISLVDTNAYDLSHIAMTTLFVHRTEATPAWEDGQCETGRFYRRLAPFTDDQSLLLTCTDELVDPLCNGMPAHGASLFLQVVPR